MRYANPALLRAVGKPRFRSGAPLRELLGEDIFCPYRAADAARLAGRDGAFVDTSILESMAEGLVMLDREGRVVEANRAAEQLLSLTHEQL